MSTEKKTAYERFLSEFNKNTVTDRLDYPYILLEALRLINLLRVDPNYDSTRVDEAIQTLSDMIPESARDDQFKKDLDTAYDPISVDMRHIFCEVRVGKKTLENQKETNVMNHSKQLHAVVNLIDRMNMGLKGENKGFVGVKNEG